MDSKSSAQQLNEDQERLVDAALIENLRMTPEERVDAHEAALRLMDDLAEAGKGIRAQSK